MKKGYTLVEMLLVLLLIPMILSLSVSLLRSFSRIDRTETNQNDVFKRQLRQLLQRSVILDCTDQTVSFTYLNEAFEIYHDRGRVVKSPGYEILHEPITDFKISCETSITFFYTYAQEADFVEVETR